MIKIVAAWLAVALLLAVVFGFVAHQQGGSIAGALPQVIIINLITVAVIVVVSLRNRRKD